ncbi:MAG: hypothetical protein JRN39_02090, partial [Nitrososphaerota archaeon]|nr:hypothetical protein [Nitrososphaerota archaeon]
VSGIYDSAYAPFGEEAMTSLTTAREVSGLGAGSYSYVRTGGGCPPGNSTVSLGLPQFAARILASPLPRPGYSVYVGAAPLVNSMAAVAAVLVAGSVASLWVATDLYLHSFDATTRIMVEQGAPRIRAAFAKRVLPPVLASSALGAFAAAISFDGLGLGGLMHYSLLLPPPAYPAAFSLLVAFASAGAVLAYGPRSR